MYLADSTTGACRGVYQGITPPAGTTDTASPFTDGRMVWSGSAWELPTAVKAQDERSWRDAELKLSDWMALSDSPAMSAEWTTYRQELRDMPTLAGFPDTHTRPVAPV